MSKLSITGVHRAAGARNGCALNRSSLAAALVLQLLYSTPKPSEKPLSKKERNNLIRTRYAEERTRFRGTANDSKRSDELALQFIMKEFLLKRNELEAILANK